MLVSKHRELPVSVCSSLPGCSHHSDTRAWPSILYVACRQRVGRRAGPAFCPVTGVPGHPRDLQQKVGRKGQAQLTPPASLAKWYPAFSGKSHHLAIKQREKWPCEKMRTSDESMFSTQSASFSACCTSVPARVVHPSSPSCQLAGTHSNSVEGRSSGENIQQRESRGYGQ